MSENNNQKMKVTTGSAPEVGAGEQTFMPLVDIYETPDGTTVIEAEVPGARAEGVDIRVDKGVLTLSAEAQLPQLGNEYEPTFTSFIGGKYFRAFALSDEVDRDKIGASLNDGVLTLSLPRAAAARTRKIEIKPG